MLFLQISSLLLLAVCSCLSAGAQLEYRKSNIAVFCSFQDEALRWSIAGNIYGQNPNIYSELKWKNLKGPAAGMELEMRTKNRLFFHVAVFKSFILSGTITDTDYAGDNRTYPLYDSEFGSNKGGTMILSGGGGLAVVRKPKLSLDASAGYTFHQQTLFLTHSDSLRRLNSSYEPKRHSGFLRMQAFHALHRNFYTAAFIQFGRGSYYAVANWNLIDTYQHPLSFEQAAITNNLQLGSKVIFSPSRLCKPFAAVSFSYEKTTGGTDVIHLSNGQSLKTHFNGAAGHSWRISAGIHADL